MPEHPRRVALIRLGDELCELAGHLAAAEARWLCLLADFDREEGWAEYGCRSCAHWLSWKLGLDRRTAREKVLVARDLEDLPVIRAAFLAGGLTYAKVRAVTRIATPETDELLAEFAKVATGAHLETLGRGYRQSKTEGGSAEPPSTFVRYRVADDGSIVGSFRLPPAEGMVFVTALDAERRCQYDDVPLDERPEVDEQCAVALLAMANKDLADIDPSGNRFMITVHTDGPTLQGEETGRTPTIENGPDVDVATAQRLMCDAKVNRMVWGPGSEILDHGRNYRTSPPAQRRAVTARDKCCRIPGCGRTRHLKVHHIRWWTDDGLTDLSNLVLLCHEHHHLVHEGGWDLRGNANEALVFLDPDGRAVDPGSVTTTSDPETLPRINSEAGLDIEPDTVTSTWLGDRCDYDTVIIALLARERRAAEAANEFAEAA
jgi:hypothetical protein